MPSCAGLPGYDWGHVLHAVEPAHAGARQTMPSSL